MAKWGRKRTVGEKVADAVSSAVGSWTFVVVQGAIMALWIIINVSWANGWDPYPFILLNLMLSFQAAYTAPFIMMSQNRAAQEDAIRTIDLHDKIDIVRGRQIDQLFSQVRETGTAITRIARLLNKPIPALSKLRYKFRLLDMVEQQRVTDPVLLEILKSEQEQEDALITREPDSEPAPECKPLRASSTLEMQELLRISTTPMSTDEAGDAARLSVAPASLVTRDQHVEFEQEVQRFTRRRNSSASAGFARHQAKWLQERSGWQRIPMHRRDDLVGTKVLNKPNEAVVSHVRTTCFGLCIVGKDAQGRTCGPRTADLVSNAIGSWTFIIVQSTLLITWIVLNIILKNIGNSVAADPLASVCASVNFTVANTTCACTDPGFVEIEEDNGYAWDPFPFILLNLMLSFQAGFTAPIILMSQTRQSEQDKIFDGDLNEKVDHMRCQLLLELSDAMYDSYEALLLLDHQLKPQAYDSPDPFHDELAQQAQRDQQDSPDDAGAAGSAYPSVASNNVSPPSDNMGPDSSAAPGSGEEKGTAAEEAQIIHG